MATYSEWIEPPLQQQVIEFSGSTFPVEGPSTGITLLGDGSSIPHGVTNDLFTSPASETPDRSLSKFVWDNLPADEPMGSISRDIFGYLAWIDYRGTHSWFLGPPGRWQQYDYWAWRVYRWKLWQRARTPQYQPELPPGAIGVEYEEWREAQLVSAAVEGLTSEDGDRGLGPGDAPYWSLFIKPPGDTSSSFYAEDPMSKNQVLASSNATDGYTLTPAELAALQSLMAGYVADETGWEDPRWMELALAYTGPFPGALPGSPPVHPINEWSYGVSPRLGLFIEFTLPRYRFVFDAAPRIPRRIFPRDDGLTGGARRVWPPNKSHQWGNRVDGSGYL